MKVLLATLHSRYVHNSLALPCLAAACRGIAGVTTVIREFTINEPADRVLRALVDEDADVAAFSCYIWNIDATLRLVADLKLIRPDTFVILGGPEASFGVFELMTQNPAVDCVVRGEGEETFRELASFLAKDEGRIRDLHDICAGIVYRSGPDILSSPERLPIRELDAIPSPFAAGLADLAKPLVYYETSRGCPFSCAFCLSSLDREVRSFSMERIRTDLGILMAKGAQTVKFVDRTFNYGAGRANEIWEFILKENKRSKFHFEIAADLLTEENFRVLAKVPPGMFRFEIGVQSGEEVTLARVGRRTDMAKLYDNVRRLRAETGVLVHLDLVAGLPGEDLRGFLRSLETLFGLLANGEPRQGETAPHVQVELLKVLKGSPMRRIAEEENYAFSASPPYRVLSTPWLSYGEVCRIDAISGLVDLLFNSGRFAATLAHIAKTQPLSEFFAEAAEFWELEKIPANLAQPALFEALWRFAESRGPGEGLDEFREALCYDFCLAEYPSARGLPPFFAGAVNTLAKAKRDEIVGKLEIAAGSRIRTFSMAFARDYRSTPWMEGAVELLFVYASAPGKGLRTEVLPCEK